MTHPDTKYIQKYRKALEKHKMYASWTRGDKIMNHGGAQRQVSELLRNSMSRHLKFTLGNQDEYDTILELERGANPWGEVDIVSDLTGLILNQRLKHPFNFGEHLTWTDKETRYDIDSPDFNLIRIQENGLSIRCVYYIQSVKSPDPEILKAYQTLPQFINEIAFSNGFNLLLESSQPFSHNVHLFKKNSEKSIYSINF